MKRLSAAFALLILLAGFAQAQSGHYPARAIRWVIPYPAGGGADIIARPIALAMGELIGQPIVYDNRGGGSGIIAGEIVARAAPDGYTLLLGNPSLIATNPSLYPKMPFDTLKNFTAISKFASVPNMLAAHPSLPARTVQELIDFAKAHPGKVNWASSSVGSGGHLAIELIQARTGIKVVHVAYKGAGPALVGLVGGNVQLLFAGPGVLMQHIKAGRLRALAIGSLQRAPIAPEVPTLHESGLPGMETGSWHGLMAPTGTPATAIRFLHAATVKVLNMPEIASRLAADGAIASGNTPEQFGKDIRAETAMWARVIREAKVKLD